MQQDSKNPNDSAPDEQPVKNVRSPKDNLPGPKRGAFPTPREEIERSTPYVPGSGQADEEPAIETIPPPDIDE
jgi:hypothetical protein